MSEVKKETCETAQNKCGIILPIAGIMVCLTLLNIVFTYFIIQYNEYKTYGSKSNYEKVLVVNKAQYDSTIWKMTMEELKKNIAEATGGAVEEVNAKLEKTDLAYHTPVYGKADAKYSIYDFTDLDCPHCQSFHNSGVAKQAVDKNPETLNHVIRNFPLEQIHPYARAKAEASLCVAEIANEKYFEAKDALFNKIDGSTKEKILAGLSALGIDSAKLDECMTSGKYSETVSADLNLWVKMWVTGTPSIFVVNNETGEFSKLNSRSVEAIEALMK